MTSESSGEPPPPPAGADHHVSGVPKRYVSSQLIDSLVWAGGSNARGWSVGPSGLEAKDVMGKDGEDGMQPI